ncbi:peptidase inhibitor family I36 protein [Plectonema cf. radiosum LEGE 06105]|uniref:Peptidase inhibitor family I36 protein n=1 Tax=Plectonema cf. radiosum LEGE 06105 TaxID=945769 RepID=A0A8J7F183_9CYAN|nr:beta/gamma crystallin-related protein [Plectonema radiosum]MBE9214191.1 peptidase inhibitor family I36 protein [Plectonema cf. radiosum LEGE 06105]
MKEVQNQQLFQELANEVAATCSGGVAQLYEHPNFRGRKLTFRYGTNDLRKYNFNDKTSSITISPGETWAFYRDINYGGPRTVLTGGRHPYVIPNDSISSLKRI